MMRLPSPRCQTEPDSNLSYPKSKGLSGQLAFGQEKISTLAGSIFYLPTALKSLHTL